MAGVGSHVFHDAVNVIFDGEFGKMQPCSDFFVGETLRDKCHELALARRKARSVGEKAPSGF